ncbi:IclR family transcriptional regulator domain-containing protein [Terrarubrum flagellatum]|uniref:IclR family transcriptional regulator domain-containing protein n=1 Tax=Terrirubrum flagellatum TaxID=2895980 RepID=UPI003144DF43
MAEETVDSLRKGLAMLRSFRQARQQTITEAAAATGMTRAAARRFLRTLCEEGLARSDGKHFELTAAVLELGSGYLTGMTELDTFRDVLADLTSQFGESASAATLEGQDVVYIARSAARHRVMTTNLAVGTRLPAHATSMGQAILAQLNHNELDHYFSRAKLDAFTPHTLTTKQEIRQRLDRVRTLGYALVSEELELGLRSIAVAVPGRSRHARLAINISTHANRTSEETLRERYLPELLRAAERVSLVALL